MKTLFFCLYFVSFCLCFSQNYLLPAKMPIRAISKFDDRGLAVVCRNAVRESHWADWEGNIISKQQADSLLNEKPFYTTISGGKMGLLSKTGQVLIPFDYVYLYPTYLSLIHI